MFRQRQLVRQGAVSIGSSSEISAAMPSTPPPLPRRRRNSHQDVRLFQQLSPSDSLDSLLLDGAAINDATGKCSGTRRHSVACGVLYVQKPSIKSAFHSAVRRMSDACSLLSSAPFSTYNLAATKGKEEEEVVVLPQVLGTFHQKCLPPPGTHHRRPGYVNRRFSTDCPPPTYSEVTGRRRQPIEAVGQCLEAPEDEASSRE